MIRLRKQGARDEFWLANIVKRRVIKTSTLYRKAYFYKLTLNCIPNKCLSFQGGMGEGGVSLLQTQKFRTSKAHHVLQAYAGNLTVPCSYVMLGLSAARSASLPWKGFSQSRIKPSQRLMEGRSCQRNNFPESCLTNDPGKWMSNIPVPSLLWGDNSDACDLPPLLEFLCRLLCDSRLISSPFVGCLPFSVSLLTTHKCTSLMKFLPSDLCLRLCPGRTYIKMQLSTQSNKCPHNILADDSDTILSICGTTLEQPNCRMSGFLSDIKSEAALSSLLTSWLLVLALPNVGGNIYVKKEENKEESYL